MLVRRELCGVSGLAEDSFAVLGLGRCLRLNENDLERRYDERCREAHPDAGGDRAEFQALQRAFAVLKSPGRRLRHWLELEGEAFDPRGEMDHEVMAHFGDLSAALRHADEISRRQGDARSALTRSLAQREALAVQDELGRLRELTAGLIADCGGRFEGFERRGASASREEAGETARTLLFLEKGDRQLRAAWAKLAG